MKRVSAMVAIDHDARLFPLPPERSQAQTLPYAGRRHQYPGPAYPDDEELTQCKCNGQELYTRSTWDPFPPYPTKQPPTTFGDTRHQQCDAITSLPGLSHRFLPSAKELNASGPQLNSNRDSPLRQPNLGMVQHDPPPLESKWYNRGGPTVYKKPGVPFSRHRQGKCLGNASSRSPL